MVVCSEVVSSLRYFISVQINKKCKIYVQTNKTFQTGSVLLRRYFRSGQEMIKMGRVYEEEGNLEAAYVLYLKYITLFLEKIHTHRSEQKANISGLYQVKFIFCIRKSLKILVRIRIRIRSSEARIRIRTKMSRIHPAHWFNGISRKSK